MNSPIGWIGGKRALRKEIIALFPQDGVGRYIEVFFGAGWVFFSREKQPGQLEVINDRDGQFIPLYQVPQSRPSGRAGVACFRA